MKSRNGLFERAGEAIFKIRDLADEVYERLDDGRQYLFEWKDEIGERILLASVGSRITYHCFLVFYYYERGNPEDEARHAKALVPLMRRLATAKSMSSLHRDVILLLAERLETTTDERKEILDARASEARIYAPDILGILRQTIWG